MGARLRRHGARRAGVLRTGLSTVRVPDDRELIALWERGLDRHPIDRALLLGVWARSDLAPSRLAELPLGALNSALLRLREALFGPYLDALADCARCGSRTELAPAVGELLSASVDGDVRDELDLPGFRFRVPDSRDLASVASAPEAGAAALQLLERCCVDRPEGCPNSELHRLLADVEAGLATLDPAADFALVLECQSCGEAWTASLNVPELLWAEVDARARMVLGEVHSLAGAYGWSEADILALSPRRRAAYMDMIDA